MTIKNVSTRGQIASGGQKSPQVKTHSFKFCSRVKNQPILLCNLYITLSLIHHHSVHQSFPFNRLLHSWWKQGTSISRCHELINYQWPLHTPWGTVTYITSGTNYCIGPQSQSTPGSLSTKGFKIRIRCSQKSLVKWRGMLCSDWAPETTPNPQDQSASATGKLSIPLQEADKQGNSCRSCRNRKPPTKLGSYPTTTSSETFISQSVPAKSMPLTSIFMGFSSKSKCTWRMEPKLCPETKWPVGKKVRKTMKYSHSESYIFHFHF